MTSSSFQTDGNGDDEGGDDGYEDEYEDMNENRSTSATDLPDLKEPKYRNL